MDVMQVGKHGMQLGKHGKHGKQVRRHGKQGYKPERVGTNAQQVIRMKDGVVWMRCK